MLLPAPATLPAVVKTKVQQRNDHHDSTPLGEVAKFAQGRVTEDLLISTKFELDGGTAFWPCLDIEAKAAHGDISANIRAAQATAAAMMEHGLWCEGVQVLLSGRGFRFAWPTLIQPEQAELFRLCLKDAARWPHMDAGPNLRGTPMRVAGSRIVQVGDAFERRHVALLSDPWQLFHLDEPSYRRVAAGPGDVWQRDGLLRAILPHEWAGPDHPWSRFLDETYARPHALGKSIVEVRLPRSTRHAAHGLARALAYVEGLGQAPRPLEVGESTIYKIESCPRCGESGWKTWIAGGGWLRCFRASCEANEGLPPSKWVEGYELDVLDLEPDEPAPDHGPGLPLEEARRQLREAFDLEGDVLINATPGVCKTHAALDYLQQFRADGCRAVYAAPTHALAEEVLSKALARGIDAKHVRGMDEEFCGEGWAKVREFTDRGFSPKAMFCKVSCPKREACPWLAQKLDAALIVTSHAALPVHGWRGMDLFIVDESAAGALLESHAVPWSAMERIAAHLPESSRNVLLGMEDCLRDALAELEKCDKPHIHARLWASEPPEGGDGEHCSIWDVLCVSEADLQGLQRDLCFFEQGDGEKWLKWQWELFRSGVNQHALRWLEAALEARVAPGEAGTLYLRVTRDDDPFQAMRVHNHAADLARGARLVLLDGTGDHAECEGLWRRPIKAVSIQAELARTRCMWLRRGLGKGKARKISEGQIDNRLAECVQALPDGARKILLLTHLAIKEQALAAAQRLAPDLEWSALHHFGPRGVNAYEDHDAVIVFGTPTASPAGSLDAACAMFREEDERGKWIASLGLRDLSQGIHRVRPVQGGRTIIVMGNHYPPELPAPLVLDGKRKGAGVLEAKRRLRAWLDRFGVLTPDMAALCGVGFGPDGEKHVEAAQKWLLELKKDLPLSSPSNAGNCRDAVLEFLSTLISTYIRVERNSDTASLYFPVNPREVKGSILLKNNNAWSNMLAALRQETGLPALKLRGGTAGRPQNAIGFVDDAERFYKAMGKAVLPRFEGIRRDGSPTPPPEPIKPVKEPYRPTYEPFDAEEWRARKAAEKESAMSTATPPPVVGALPNAKPRTLAKLPLYPGPLPVTWNPTGTRAALAQGAARHA